MTADLEKKTALKVTMHMDVEVVEDVRALKTGDVVWFTFSEQPYYIQGLLPPNAIESTITRLAEQLAASYLETGNQKTSVDDGPNFKDKRIPHNQKQQSKSTENGTVDISK